MNAASIISWLECHVPKSAHLCLDTRQLSQGDVFLARPGVSGDGRQYIGQAIERGAAAIVMQADAENSTAVSHSVPVLQVDDLSSEIGQVAHLWYGQPSVSMTVIAVTGTNGKTSCVQWLAAALNADGVPCGTVGTLGVSMPDGSNLGGALTTPDVCTLHRSLAAMREAGAQVVALEASSIGLAQGRLDHVQIDIAGFTNLTHDHLDYHHSLESYKLAKFALFHWPSLRRAVINADDAAGRELLEALPKGLAHAFTTRSDVSDAALVAQDIHTGAYGVMFNLQSQDGAAQLPTRLVGEHNVSNLLLVASVLQEMGWDLHKTARILSTLAPVEGRLQIIEPLASFGRGNAVPLVVVDYAHTPDALERALLALREVATVRGGKLSCVFGCGGSRDRGKRPMMGGIAANHADVVTLTNDNPRTEDPDSIIGEILVGMSGVTPNVEKDRALAILTAIWQAGAGDVVLLAGKGHETYQEVGETRSPFDDRDWAGCALAWLQCAGMSTDTRSLTPGQLFLALKGDNFDGHDYLARAQDAGACGAIVESRKAGLRLPQFAVGDTRRALVKIATAWRRLFDMPVVGVTGSNGKTTTKEMIASILRCGVGEEATLATRGNLNNDIGVPLTVLRLRPQHRAAVFEMGMNHPGEIGLLSAIAQPNVALVNNAQREHQEFMHSVEAVASENGAVIESLTSEGMAVFPGDDAYTPLWTQLAGHRRMVRFGFDSAYEVHADYIHAEPARTLFQLHTPEGGASVKLSAPGLHNLRNALAAAAAAYCAGIALTAIAQGLENFNPVAGRMQPRAWVGEFQLIDDTYNANPDSVRAAIDVLAQLSGKKVLVLGDMAEVGANSDAMHAEVGSYARECGIDVLLTTGRECEHATAAFGKGAHGFKSIDELVQYLQTLTPAHILVKGSRSARMERVLRALEEQTMNQEEGARHAT